MFTKKPEIMLVYHDDSVQTVSGDDIAEVATSRRKPKACIIFADYRRGLEDMVEEITIVFRTLFPNIEIHRTDNGNDLPVEYRWLRRDGNDKALRRRV